MSLDLFFLKGKGRFQPTLFESCFVFFESVLSRPVLLSMDLFFLFVYFLIIFLFSRMRSEGFSFNSGGLGVESCSRSVVSMFATVRNRPQPFATVRNRPQPFAVGR